MRKLPSLPESTSTTIFVEVFCAETNEPSNGWPSEPFTVPLTVAAETHGTARSAKTTENANLYLGSTKPSRQEGHHTRGNATSGILMRNDRSLRPAKRAKAPPRS